MAGHAETERGHLSARSYRVWDPLVRLVHWTVVLGVVLNGMIVDDEGKAHELIGYAVLAVVLVRLLWGVIGPASARFSAFVPYPRAVLNHAKEAWAGDRVVHLSHNPLGALMAYSIWLTLLVICGTGVMMGSIRFFGVQWVEEVHELAFNWLVLSVVIHVGGVVLDQRRTGVGLVKAMITGRKDIPDGWSVK